MAAGSIVQATGTRNIEEMGGLIKRMPATSALFLVGAISISALPPFNGFVSELMIFLGFFKSGALLTPVLEIVMFVCLSLFAFTSSLAAACFVKAFGITFLAMPRSDHSKNAREVKIPMLIGPGILAILCFILGVSSSQLFAYLGFNLPIPNLLVISSVAIISAVFIILIVKILSRSKFKERIDETWGCGILSQNPKMQYSASGFSEPIINIFKPIYRTNTHVEKQYFDKHNTLLKQGLAEIHLFKIFEEYLYLPIARFIMGLSFNLAKIQNVIEPDSYILYTFVTFLLLLIIGGWFI
jgi:NADH:ubiquinone oxidoreductase subunit 5 (subunit L)/multisubunit Na+/H+ antiporter MnhA subunit